MISAQNVVVYDQFGIPSFMVRFTKEKNEALFAGGSSAVHPAFIIGGEEVDEIFISQYANTIIDGRAYSLPLQQPATSLNYEAAMAACFGKGEGWHLMTAAEYALVLHHSHRAGTMPHGNTSYGKYHGNPEERGTQFSEDSGKTLTGSGPATWTHDHTIHGVHDLVGNVWEWNAGLRLMNGEIQIIPDNNAAAPHDYSEGSPLWQPILKDGKTMKYGIDNEDEVKLTTEEVEEGWTGSRWETVQSDVEVPEIVKALALMPTDKQDLQSVLYVDTEAERLPFRGGSFHYTSNAGLGALGLNLPRSYVSTTVGFRSAFYRKTGN